MYQRLRVQLSRLIQSALPCGVAALTMLALASVSPVAATATELSMYDGLSPAAAAVIQLQSSISSVSLLTDYTQDSDPEHLLGLPGQYVAKATFHDSQLSSNDSSEVSASVEVFANERDLSKRQSHMERSANEQDVTVGTVLVRLFSSTTSDQVSAYESAAHGIVLT